MAGYFAELQNNIVQRVVSATEAQWCVDTYGGEWVQTYYATAGKNYAGKDYIYVPEVDNFHVPQPYRSWTLDDNCKWQPPTPQPQGYYRWNESTLMWDNLI